MIPTVPGWYLGRLTSDTEIQPVRVAPGLHPAGLEAYVCGSVQGCRLDDFQWLCPVAPPGSVAPAEHAWAVRDAYLSDWIDGFPDHGWGGSAPRSDLIARVGADVVEGVER